MFIVFAQLLTRGSFPWRELELVAGCAAGDAMLLAWHVCPCFACSAFSAKRCLCSEPGLPAVVSADMVETSPLQYSHMWQGPAGPTSVSTSCLYLTAVPAG